VINEISCVENLSFSNCLPIKKEKVEELICLCIDGYIKKPFDRDTALAEITQVQQATE